VILMDYLGFEKPINFMYGVHGVLLVETLHLFPLMTLPSWTPWERSTFPWMRRGKRRLPGAAKFWDITFP